jgi:hypothetical protein
MVTHKGKRIVIVDISNCTSDKISPFLDEAQRKIATFPPKSALILTEVTNAVYDKVTSDAMKAFSSKNTPYVKASAVVGADGLRSVLLTTIAIVTRRDIKSFKSRADAMDWLAQVA